MLAIFLGAIAATAAGCETDGVWPYALMPAVVQPAPASDELVAQLTEAAEHLMLPRDTWVVVSPDAAAKLVHAAATATGDWRGVAEQAGCTVQALPGGGTVLCSAVAETRARPAVGAPRHWGDVAAVLALTPVEHQADLHCGAWLPASALTDEGRAALDRCLGVISRDQLSASASDAYFQLSVGVWFDLRTHATGTACRSLAPLASASLGGLVASDQMDGGAPILAPHAVADRVAAVPLPVECAGLDVVHSLAWLPRWLDACVPASAYPGTGGRQGFRAADMEGSPADTHPREVVVEEAVRDHLVVAPAREHAGAGLSEAVWAALGMLPRDVGDVTMLAAPSSPYGLDALKLAGPQLAAGFTAVFGHRARVALDRELAPAELEPLTSGGQFQPVTEETATWLLEVSQPRGSLALDSVAGLPPGEAVEGASVRGKIVVALWMGRVRMVRDTEFGRMLASAGGLAGGPDGTARYVVVDVTGTGAQLPVQWLR